MKHYNIYQLHNRHPRWTCLLLLSEADIDALNHCRKDAEGRCFLSSNMIDRVQKNNVAKHLYLSTSIKVGNSFLVDITNPYQG